MWLDVLLSSTWTRLEVLGTVLTYPRDYPWHLLDAVLAFAAAWALVRWLRISRLQPHTTQLRGPRSESFLYGIGKRVMDAEDSGAVYEAWAQEYGSVYAVPSTLGSKRIVLCDPKAIAHFYGNEGRVYAHPPFVRAISTKMFGNSLSVAQGDDHRKQRKCLNPAFSITAIRQLTSIFYEIAYKAKGAWEDLIQSSGGDSAIIEVQNWMNHISIDSIGLAGFSHNFGALEGKSAHVTEVFNTFGPSSRSTTLDKAIILLGLLLPSLARLPTSRTRLFHELNLAMEEIVSVLLARTRVEKEMGEVVGKERSIVGLLIKDGNASSEFHLTKDEIMSQMKVILFAGYETTSITLTWTLIELSRNPDVQTKLRNELLSYDTDPTYDQLVNDLPYLDVVVHEILRLHPPLGEFTRVAIEDDVIPLSEPIRTKSGKLADRVTIAKGSHVAVSIQSMNRSAVLWGKDAKIFRPERWLEDTNGQDGIPIKAREIQGHRHLLTFGDGPRLCLGKVFALAELKIVLAVLVKNFIFEPRDGADLKVELEAGLLLRPKIAGEVNCNVPLRVRPYVI